MTIDLETRILNQAKDVIYNISTDDLNKNDCNEVLIPFGCPINTLVYSVKEKRYVRIEYEVGVGKCYMRLMNGGYYDKTETRVINL